MAQFLNKLNLKKFSAASSSALEFSVSTDSASAPRLVVDAGGKHTWGGGTVVGDTNLYRSAADTLKTDDYFIATGGLTVESYQVTTTGASTGTVLKFDGTKFAPGVASAVGALDDLSDVVITTPTSGQIVYYDGTNWVNGTSFAESTKHIVKNDSGGTLSAGAAVYTSGANGTNILVKGAQANTEATSASVIGLLATSLAANGIGYVITQGLIAGLNTSTATVGDPVWLSPTTAGGIVFGLANKPSAPNHLVYMGTVTRVNANNGEIFVHILNGWELEELHNVQITSPTAGHTLYYDGSLWKNDTSVLFLDTTFNRLGINNSSPLRTLDVTGGVNIYNSVSSKVDAFVENSTSTTYGQLQISDTDLTLQVGDYSWTSKLYMQANTVYMEGNRSTLGITTSGGLAEAKQAGYVPFTVKGTTSQSANLQEWKNSSNTVVASVSPAGNLTIAGDLTVNGTTTTINSTVVTVDDILVELGSVASPTDVTAAGGGIVLKGATDKSITWGSTNGWTSTETFNLASGKTYRINGTDVLSGSTLGSGVTSSSLTSVGTITSGTWSASFGAVSGANLTNLTAGNLTGTIPSTVLGNSTVYIGTTAVALNRSSANQALTGISSVTLPGATSGTIQLTPTAVAGTGTIITLPATTGTVVTTGDTGTVTSTMIADGTIVNADINASAAIALSKLATGTAGRVVLANASGVPTYTAISGDITINSSGVATISANSVALGTDTTGDYVASINSGTGVSVSGAFGAGSLPTISIGQAVGTTDSPSFAGLTVGSASVPAFYSSMGSSRVGIGTNMLSASGQVTIKSTSTSYAPLILQNASGQTASSQEWQNSMGSVLAYVSSTGDIFSYSSVTGASVSGYTITKGAVLASDADLTLRYTASGTPSQNANINVNRGTSPAVAIRWNETTDKWQFTNDGTTYKDLGSGGITVSDTAPSTPATGDLWYESDTGSTYVYYDSYWIEIGGAAAYNPITGTIQAKGDLLAGTASQTLDRLAVGADGTRLAASSAASTGVAWVADTQNTVIDAKGDLLVGTANDTLTRLPVGTNGQILTADSTQTGGIGWATAPSAFRNKIINGTFDIWQRGTSQSAGGYGSADRWLLQVDGAGATRSMSQQAFTAGNPISGYEPTYFLRYNQSVAGSGATYNLLDQRIEDVRTLAGQQVAVSFWAKADTTRTLTSQIQQVFGTGGSAEVQAIATQSHTVTTSWQRFTYTATMASISGKTIGTNSYVAFRFNFPNNATFTFDIWGVQVEAGTTSTPLEIRPYGTELALCQRYYSSIQFDLELNGLTSMSYLAWLALPQPLRGTPQITANLGGTNYTSGSLLWQASYPNAVRATATITTNGYVRFNCAPASIFNAEL